MIKSMISSALLASAAPATAAIVYQNNFDAENGGMPSPNYTGFNGLHVISGSVDLVNASSGITCPSGSCVDLAGTPGAFNQLATNVFHYLAGDTVSIEFLIGGDQTNSSEPYGISMNFLSGGILSRIGGTVDGTFDGPPAFPVLGSFGAGGTVSSNAPATMKKLYFTALAAGDAYFILSTQPTISVKDLMSPPTFSDDDSGPILDNLVVRVESAVPEPASWALMVSGFGLVGGFVRRHKATVTFV